jgi:hypothetical protein
LLAKSYPDIPIIPHHRDRNPAFFTRCDDGRRGDRGSLLVRCFAGVAVRSFIARLACALMHPAGRGTAVMPG